MLIGVNLDLNKMKMRLTYMIPCCILSIKKRSPPSRYWEKKNGLFYFLGLKNDSFF